MWTTVQTEGKFLSVKFSCMRFKFWRWSSLFSKIWTQENLILLLNGSHGYSIRKLTGKSLHWLICFWKAIAKNNATKNAIIEKIVVIVDEWNLCWFAKDVTVHQLTLQCWCNWIDTPSTAATPLNITLYIPWVAHHLVTAVPHWDHWAPPPLAWCCPLYKRTM